MRSYDDRLDTGAVIYLWGDYVSPDHRMKVSLGVSPRLGVHDVEVCHLTKGDEPTWHGSFDLATQAASVALTAAMYRDGSRQWLEASSVCQGGRCAQYSQEGRHMTMVAAVPEGRLPLMSTLGPVPILLKVESSDITLAPAVSEALLQQQLAGFLGAFDLGRLTLPYGRRH